jgi:hypothetical protein
MPKTSNRPQASHQALALGWSDRRSVFMRQQEGCTSPVGFGDDLQAVIAFCRKKYQRKGISR